MSSEADDVREAVDRYSTNSRWRRPRWHATTPRTGPGNETFRSLGNPDEMRSTA